MNMCMTSDGLGCLIGKRVLRILFNNEKNSFIIALENSNPEKFNCEGECCSESWIVQEKVDGTNIRVLKDGKFAGRTEVSSIPPFLLKRLEMLFPKEKLRSVFGDKDFILFGEGYGNKIQKCFSKMAIQFISN